MDEPKRGDGLDCTCAAWAYFECACGADWTPREVYELRAERDEYKRVAEILDDKQGELRAEVAKLNHAITEWKKEEVLWKEREAALLEDKRVLVEALKYLDEAFAPIGGSDTAKQALKKVETK